MTNDNLITNASSETESNALIVGAVNGGFSHEEFISKLKDLGFEVKVCSINDRDYRFQLEVNGLNISGHNYHFFGYYCGGNYNSCSRSTQIEFTQFDIDNCIKESMRIINKEIDTLNHTPNYYGCKDYFYANPVKTKIEKDSLTRAFDLIHNNYNNIISFMRFSGKP